MIARNVFVTVLMLAFAVSPVFAQIGANTGLRGVVTDPTGASVPDANITISNLDTGESRKVVSNESGAWEARFLSPGRYRLMRFLARQPFDWS